jgi:hypothetical protein
VLQHLHDPARAVVEMLRVTRPGGRASVPDVDWHTLTITGGDIAVAQEVARHQAFVAASQGDIGRRLVQLLMDAGCKDGEVDAEVALFRDLGTANFVQQIRSTLEAAISGSAIARDAGEVGEGGPGTGSAGWFFASVNVVMCTGTAPVALLQKSTDLHHVRHLPPRTRSLRVRHRRCAASSRSLAGPDYRQARLSLLVPRDGR